MESATVEQIQETPGKETEIRRDSTVEHQIIDIVRPAISKNRTYLVFKRCFDIIMAFVLGMILLIPMLIIAALIRIDSPGPALFKQERLGLNGKPFTILKFRTMRPDAPAEVPTNDFTDSDKYMTRLGRLLRRSSIDELPQLWNILIGDMSFVGYRPVCLTEVKLNELRQAYGVFETRPGLTGYAQVMGRDKINAPEKAKLDAEYVRKRSIRMDLWCLYKTVEIVITGEGVK